MPEETSTSTTVCESVVSTQAASPDSRPVDTEAMSMSQPQPSSVSTISSAAAPALTGVAPIPAASTTCSGIMLSPPPLGACGRPVRDSSWLELDICRDFQKEGSCSRSDQCRFAHPEPNVVNRDGKVTCCYDFLKDRCYRERCKYFHPPSHIKERLVAAGKQYGAMMSNMYSMTNAAGIFPATVPIPAVQHPVVSFDGCLVTSPPPPPPAAAAAAGISPAFVVTPYGTLTERLHVCPEFLRGQCSVELCPFAHPEPHIRQNFDMTVRMCRDFIRTGCQRERCRYFHPPQHIMAQVDSIMSLQAIGLPQGMFIAPSPMMSSPTNMGFQPAGPVMFAGPHHHPSFSLSSPIPASTVPIYPAAAVPVSVISSSGPSPAQAFSHHFPMANVVSVQSISTQPTTFVQPPILSPMSSDAINGHQVGAAQVPNLAIA